MLRGFDAQQAQLVESRLKTGMELEAGRNLSGGRPDRLMPL